MSKHIKLNCVLRLLRLEKDKILINILSSIII